MNKKNYDNEFQKQVEVIANNEKKPKLLLHCCCAVCSSACLERLKDYFDITLLFYNPNIESEEYFKRKEELIKLVRLTGWGKIYDLNYSNSEYYESVKGLESEKEGGKRCEVCFNLRLEKTAQIAKENNFDYFTTTLTISPLKNAEIINEIGEKLAQEKNIKWLYSDFKKKNGYLRSTILAKEFDLYRQNYCGCIFSLTNA